MNSLSDIYNKLSADGKDKLNALLTNSSKNYCIYIIICDIISNVNNLAMAQWYTEHLNNGDGIWIGNNITQQYRLKLSGYSNLNQEVRNGFGYIVENGKARFTKLISEEEFERITLYNWFNNLIKE